MTYYRGDRSESAASEPSESYVQPMLTLIGNLNDLLAGGGTKDADQTVCTTGGTDSDPDCAAKG